MLPSRPPFLNAADARTQGSYHPSTRHSAKTSRASVHGPLDRHQRRAPARHFPKALTLHPPAGCSRAPETRITSGV